MAWPRQCRRLSELARFKGLKRLNFKPRLAQIEEASDAEHKLKITHFALDAV
jgi:hypothetical protein